MLSSAKHKINHSAFSVSSSSSSLPHSYSQAKNMTQVTMEEVWKDINLASLHQHRQLNIDHEPVLSNQNPNNSIFKDFLKKPLNQEPQPLPPSSSSSTLHRSLPPPPPETVLSLNPHSINTHFDESARFGCFGMKRGGQESDESRGDRRHKRMIKNRESAARSRARKQAYTNELELAISHLQKENARLKRQEEQLKMAEATQHQTKRKLQRSWTTPF
ncbi:bZIP transcription factor 27 isoform X2 [Brassica napus]|uniref:protein FD n=1 Tax=Brassica oleracea var. oleracea TaxID=109376 RepID=UPI0006A6B64B|nr:PREDICTED: protein FD [Brassica oleracea var. oleracea]XP_013747008.1 bZIP transcription factor 27 isoform X2 [Brassica napus]